MLDKYSYREVYCKYRGLPSLGYSQVAGGAPPSQRAHMSQGDGIVNVCIYAYVYIHVYDICVYIYISVWGLHRGSLFIQLLSFV